jgi:hypothetical protein
MATTAVGNTQWTDKATTETISGLTSSNNVSEALYSEGPHPQRRASHRGHPISVSHKRASFICHLIGHLMGAPLMGVPLTGAIS